MTSSKVVLVSSSSSNTTMATKNNRRTALVRTDSVASMRARSLLASKGWESFSQRNNNNNNSTSTASSRTGTKRLQTPRRCISSDVLDPHVIESNNRDDSSLSCRDNSPLARVVQPENDKDMDGDGPPTTTTTTTNYGSKHTQATFRARQLVASRSWEGLHFEALLSLDKHGNGNSNENNHSDNDESDNDDDDDDDSTVSFSNSLLDENDEDNDEEF